MKKTFSWKAVTTCILAALFLVLASASTGQAMMLKLSTAELNSEADLVIVGTVDSTASHWNSEQTNIYTTVEISVAKVLQGTLAQKSIKVRVPGGEIDGMTETVTNAPVFQKGEEVLLFLNKPAPESSVQNFASAAPYGVSGNFQGKLKVKDSAVGGISLKALEDDPGLLNETELDNKDTASIKTGAGSTVVYSTAHDLFIDQGKRWAENATAITFRANGTPDQNNHVQKAAETWNNIEANFSLLYEGEIDHANYVSYNGINEVIFYDMERRDVLALAHVRSFGSRIVEADMAFNTSFNWSTSENSPAGHYDVQTVALHEFGHWLGLGDHYGKPELAMYYQYGGIKRDLHEGDIEGAIHNFGLADGEAPAHEKLNINISANPTGGGAVEGSGVYEKDQDVVAAVKAYENFTFLGWEEDGRVVSTDTVYAFKATSDRSLIATFNRQEESEAGLSLLASNSAGIIYNSNHSWSNFDRSAADEMAYGDITGDGNKNLVTSSPAAGIRYRENGAWVSFDAAPAAALLFADLTGDGKENFVFSQRSGTRYLEDGEKILLDNNEAGAMAYGDMTGDGRNNLVTSTPLGLRYLEDGAWVNIISASADALTFADLTGDGRNNFVASAPVGTFYREAGQWVRLHRSSVRAMVYGDITGDGTDNLIVAHQSGLYYNHSGSWLRLGRTSAEAICFADLSGE